MGSKVIGTDSSKTGAELAKGRAHGVVHKSLIHGFSLSFYPTEWQ